MQQGWEGGRLATGLRLLGGYSVSCALVLVGYVDGGIAPVGAAGSKEEYDRFRTCAAGGTQKEWAENNREDIN